MKVITLSMYMYFILLHVFLVIVVAFRQDLFVLLIHVLLSGAFVVSEWDSTLVEGLVETSSFITSSVWWMECGLHYVYAISSLFIFTICLNIRMFNSSCCYCFPFLIIYVICTYILFSFRETDWNGKWRCFQYGGCKVGVVGSNEKRCWWIF